MLLLLPVVITFILIIIFVFNSIENAFANLQFAINTNQMEYPNEKRNANILNWNLTIKLDEITTNNSHEPCTFKYFTITILDHCDGGADTNTVGLRHFRHTYGMVNVFRMTWWSFHWNFWLEISSRFRNMVSTRYRRSLANLIGNQICCTQIDAAHCMDTQDGQ